MKKIATAAVALAIGAGGIVAGATAMDTLAAPSTSSSVQQESVAWLPQPAKRCYWVQVGWAGKYWYCER